MAFTSTINPKEIVIDNKNFTDEVAKLNDEGHRKTGYMKRDRKKMPYGAPAPRFSMTPIPRSQWQGLVQLQEQNEARTSDFIKRHKIPSKDQDGTNYCWINAPVGIVEVIGVHQGSEYVSLSPASGGAQIKGYRNSGGWGTEALKHIIKKGIYPSSLWEDNYWRGTKYLNAAGDAEALKHRVTEWWDLPEDNFEAVATCLLNNIMVAIGLDWWGHEVYACDLVVVSAAPLRFGIRFRNSWGADYGDDGFGILSEAKGTPDDACAPRVKVAT